MGFVLKFAGLLTCFVGLTWWTRHEPRTAAVSPLELLDSGAPTPSNTNPHTPKNFAPVPTQKREMDEAGQHIDTRDSNETIDSHMGGEATGYESDSQKSSVELFPMDISGMPTTPEQGPSQLLPPRAESPSTKSFEEDFELRRAESGSFSSHVRSADENDLRLVDSHGIFRFTYHVTLRGRKHAISIHRVAAVLLGFSVVSLWITFR